MAVESFNKSNYEEYTINGDFVNVIGAGEAIATKAVSAKDKDGTDASDTVLTVASLAHSGTVCSVEVKAGSETAEYYIILFRIVTDAGNKWELPVKMKIKEAS